MRIPIYCQPLSRGQIADFRAAAILRSGQVIRMSIHRYALAAATAALISAFTGTTLRADTTLSFGVVGSPIDLSANVQEAILPGGTTFQDSMLLFGTSPDPKQSAEVLHISDVGVITPIGWHTSTSSAFASSLAESDGNGGVAVSPDNPWQRRQPRRIRPGD